MICFAILSPKNTISCGVSIGRSQQIGFPQNGLLNAFNLQFPTPNCKARTTKNRLKIYAVKP